ncbi:prepilin-type N-terminal cleavage/methylation domain-containing protein [Aquincola sp. S2]|uniref:Prepilin-type N-terminal cleavage/methylation domain-containing protein n=2 Tax=Pseudaquabacterium terrae TaxID=2732868 RepID=A0ABX2EQH1_9BURK|nr:prepilin-type N-terminal cleavage/methylation domain-containing protein [Aquabacterium terrae]
MRPCRSPGPVDRGFTLIELLITIAIVAVLASIAYPSFKESIHKGRRADAIDAMTRVQQAEERWRANHSAYTKDLSKDTGIGVSTSKDDMASPDGHYKVTVDLPLGEEGSSYIITANANNPGSQAKDTKCLMMRMTMAGGNLKYDSTSGQTCWAK